MADEKYEKRYASMLEALTDPNVKSALSTEERAKLMFALEKHKEALILLSTH
jgi:hypothetical protein